MPARRTLWTGIVVVVAFLALAAVAVGARPQPPRLVDVRVDAGDPTRVVLTFTDDPLAGRSHVSVTDGQGAPVTTGAPVTASGRTLVARVRAAASGVSYHAVFSDGQVLAGATTVDGSPAAAAADGHAHGVDPVGAVLLVVDGLAVLVCIGALPGRPRARRELTAGGRPDRSSVLSTGDSSHARWSIASGVTPAGSSAGAVTGES